jgi:hypothetical protein
MRTRSPLAAVAVVVFAGCSVVHQAGIEPTAGSAALRVTTGRNGAVSPVPPEMLQRTRALAILAFLRAPDGGLPSYTYVGQFSGTPVQEYRSANKRNRPAVCSLPGQSVNGIAVDSKGNLWVPNGTGGGAGFTQEYASNCGAAELQIDDPNGQPADVGFDRKHDIYILNIFGAAGAPGSVDVYDKQGTLLRNLSNASFSELIGIATDSHDNVFVSNRDVQGIAGVFEFPGGKMPATQLTSVQLGLPGAPQFDKADNLIITDWNSFTLNVYAKPYTGTPAVTQMAGLSLWCPLNKIETRLSCPDLGTGAVDVYRYPRAKYLYSYSNGLSPSGFASGAANDPPAPL